MFPDTEGPSLVQSKAASKLLTQKPTVKTSPQTSPVKSKPGTPNARPSCIVVISNLTDTTQRSDLEGVVKGLRNNTSLIYPVPDRDSSVAHLSFMSKRDSLRATRKLAAIKINGRVLSY